MHFRLFAVLIALGLLVSACGQRGPLYLPASPENESVTRNTEPQAEPEAADSEEVVQRAD